MRKKRPQLLRELLEEYPGGLTTTQLSDLSGITSRDLRRCLHAMPDVVAVGEVPGDRHQPVKFWRLIRQHPTRVLPRPFDPNAPRTTFVNNVWPWGQS